MSRGSQRQLPGWGHLEGERGCHRVKAGWGHTGTLLARGQGTGDKKWQITTQLAKSGELSEEAVYCKLPNTSGKLGPSAAKAQQF